MLVLKLAAKVVGLLFSALLLYFAVTMVQVYLTGRHADERPSSAILVMGTAQLNGTPSEDLHARLATALDLFNRGLAPLVAVTGGRKPGDPYTEAGVSATWLEAHGVPASHIVRAGGTDSYGNISLVAPKLKAKGATTLLVVTDPFHEMRSMAIASSFGFTPRSAPSVGSPIKGPILVLYYGKEALEVGVARVVGYGWLTTATRQALVWPAAQGVG